MQVRFGTIVAVLVLSVAVASTYAVQAQRGAAKSSGTQVMQVLKTPTCGCCSLWVDHVRAAGFDVQARDVTHEELNAFKAKHAVPESMYSCHTALVDGYVVEGHIPVNEIRRLLKERPAVAGIAVPGMPIGSPGMEVAGVKPRPYNVFTFDKQGRTQIYATVQP